VASTQIQTSSEEKKSYSDDNALFSINADILIDVIRADLGGGYTLGAQSVNGAKAVVEAMRAAGWACKVRVWQTIASGNKPGYVEWPL
jgi:hypothetical protein